jgi:tRNA_anti-like
MTDEIIEANAAKKKGCGFWALVAVGVLFALFIIGSLLPKPTPEQQAEMAAEQASDAEAAAKTQADEANAKRNSAVKVSANELFNAYERNEMAAQQQFGGKLLEVSGTVDGVNLDIGDEPVVQLRTSNQFMPVSVHLTDATQNAAAGFSKGQKITVLCEEVTEVISMPQLKECVPL